jgi:hypothetical protein
MTVPSMPSPPTGAARVLTWWANHSHRVVLPLAGVVTVGLGLALGLGGHSPWRTYAPDLLVGVGAGALASGVGALLVRHYLRSRARLRGRGASDLVYPGPSPVIDDELSPSRANARWLRFIQAGAHGDGAGSTRTIPTDPGEFLWGSWAGPKGHLPVELVSPVPETAFSPHGPGAPTLHEEGEPVRRLEPVPFEEVPRGAVQGSVTGAGSPLMLRPTAALAGGRDARATVAAWETPTDSDPAGPATVSSVVGSVHHEAVNPIPPHLRRGKGAGLGPAPGVRCANCRSPVADAASWRLCPDCRRPLCPECVVSAFVQFQHGWCSRCAPVEGTPASPDPDPLGPRPSGGPAMWNDAGAPRGPGRG